MAEYKIIVSFQGAISNDLVMYLGSVIESKQALSSRMKRLFSIFLEMSQNIMRYSAERDTIEDELEPTGVGKVMITDHDDQYLISAANKVSVSAVPYLEEQYKTVNSLSKDGLKALFLERRKNDPPPGSKGAGLGIIDIARKADTPIQYVFRKTEDPNTMLMILLVTLKK